MSADPSSAFNLEHLKKDAKRWLRACRAGDAEAIRSVRVILSNLAGLDAQGISKQIKLADVQQAIAIQRGFASWAGLTRFGDPLARLLAAVRGGHVATLRRDLPQFGGLAVMNVFAAAALGDAPALRLHLYRDSSLAIRSRDGWTALDYVCSSPLGRLSTRHATSLIDCAELLLQEGADPGSSVEAGGIPGRALSATMRAMLAGNIGLVAVLKRAGAAEPQQEMIEWAGSLATPEATKLHLAFGHYFRQPEVRAEMQKSFGAFKAEHADRTAFPYGVVPADPRELQHLRMPNVLSAQSHLWSALLDRGYDPTSIGANGRSALHGVVTYAPASFVEVFLTHGVNMHVKDADGRSVIATAVRAGNTEAADLLRARGVADDATLADRLIGACLADAAETAHDLVTEHPEVLATLSRADADEFVRAAARGAIAQVRLMLACGFPPDLVGESGATALQQAAWRGQVAVVELLLAHGASRSMQDELYGETALEWAHHGALHAQGGQGPCLEAARMLSRAERR